jgi:V/A-type H+-transporting ATPase subunit C
VADNQLNPKGKLMSRSIYLYATARLRATEHTFINKNILEKLISLNNINEAYKILSEAGYTPKEEKYSTVEEFDKFLSAKLTEYISFISDLCEDNILRELILSRFDWHNMYMWCNKNYLEQDIKGTIYNAGVLGPEKVFNILEEDKPQYLSEDLRNAFLKIKETKDSEKADFIFNQEMYGYLIKLANECRNEFILKFLRLSIDLLNAKNLQRIKILKNRKLEEENIIPGGNVDKDLWLKEENIKNSILKPILDNIDNGEDKVSLIEKKSADILLKLIKETKFIPFGPEPIFSYIPAREFELRNIRYAVLGKLNGLDKDKIREKLIDTWN